MVFSFANLLKPNNTSFVVQQAAKVTKKAKNTAIKAPVNLKLKSAGDMGLNKAKNKKLPLNQAADNVTPTSKTIQASHAKVQSWLESSRPFIATHDETGNQLTCSVVESMSGETVHVSSTPSQGSINSNVLGSWIPSALRLSAPQVAPSISSVSAQSKEQASGMITRPTLRAIVPGSVNLNPQATLQNQGHALNQAVNAALMA